ncbi:MAG: hypothetical protein LBC06_01085 [Rickettsiales bacterium]|jgi:hypothetical protein|nr:hypothetical protein [Rickettsiales bacterium]
MKVYDENGNYTHEFEEEMKAAIDRELDKKYPMDTSSIGDTYVVILVYFVLIPIFYFIAYWVTSR